MPRKHHLASLLILAMAPLLLACGGEATKQTNGAKTRTYSDWSNLGGSGANPLVEHYGHQ